MSTTSVMLGLGIVFLGLLSLSYKLNDSEQPMYNYVGVLLMALSVAVLQMIGWSALSIAENSGLTYLSGGLTEPLLWIVNIVMFVFWITLAAKSLYFLAKFLLTWAGKKFGGDAENLAP